MKATVNEIFYSISGEGISVGIPTVFIRFAGCSLRCGLYQGKKLWCDTVYALSPKAGQEMSAAEILEKIHTFTNVPTQVLLTGGEPLEGDKRRFCQELSKEIASIRNGQSYEHPRVETNGKESLSGLDCMVFSMDYKLPGSGMEKEMELENIQIIKERKNPLDEIKFVVRDRLDFDRLLEIVYQYDLFDTNLTVSAVYKECSLEELASWILGASIPNLRLSIQLHKLIWGEKRGV